MSKYISSADYWTRPNNATCMNKVNILFLPCGTSKSAWLRGTRNRSDLSHLTNQNVGKNSLTSQYLSRNLRDCLCGKPIFAPIGKGLRNSVTGGRKLRSEFRHLSFH